jgi:hypothetical protein
MNYTRCSLTYLDKDIFVALEGIVEKLEALREDEYVAGFFRKDLPQCLLWSVGVPCRFPNGPSVRAPTWNWASISEPVVCAAYPFDEVLSDLIDVNMKPTSESNDSRRGCATELVLSGFIARAGWKVNHDVPDHRPDIDIVNLEIT